ncbi:MAG: asparagine synthase (glutamine-hydrolyzing), partial [archaeon]
MCGIVGFNFEDKDLLSRMLKKLNHRGPDDSGQYIDRFISLGNTRLSIIDLDSGKQPIFNEDKSIVIVFNGEIFNYKELRSKLEPKHKFYTNSDTEVIIHLYEEFSEKLFDYLDGQFAFAIWDSNRKKILLGRDHIGICPLYYYFKNNQLIFSSEIKSILEVGNLEFNSNILNNYLQNGYINSNETIIKDILKLGPGKFLIFQNDNVSIQKYNWLEINYPKKLSKDTIIKITSEEIKKSTISDVPIGLYLSGGLDSNVICSSLDKDILKNIKSFTVNFNDSSVPNESNYAKLTAEKYNLKHFEINYSVKDVLKNFNKITYYLDQPIADPASFSYFFLSKKAAKEKTKVVLSGIGGDEVFCGYPQYRLIYYWRHIIHSSVVKNLSLMLFKLY